MARALGVFKENALSKVRIEVESAQERARADAERNRNDAEKRELDRQIDLAVNELAAGLGRLAQGDLSRQIEVPFKGRLEQLRLDFNGSLVRLQDTLAQIRANAQSIQKSGASMVLPIYSALEKMDLSLTEAAQDLGCTPAAAFWRVTFPLSLPGVVAGCLLVFIPAVGEFVIPDLLGGSETLMIGKTLWSEFNSNRDWPVSSAVAIILLMILVIPIVYFQNIQAKADGEGR